MRERPIIFSAPMVRAILDGRKTQTRRVAKPRRDPNFGCWMSPGEIALDSLIVQEAMNPYGRRGDHLWVRETWNGPFFTEDEAEDINDLSVFDVAARCEYKADGGSTPEYIDADDNIVRRWRPSIHMPRWASRILLEVTSVRIEGLHEISEADARAEGIDYDPGEGGIFHVPHIGGCCSDTASGSFRHLWEQIHGPGSWAKNPWVWVVAFRHIKVEAA